jgi:flagellar hook-basal body complex protein FliE
VDSLNQLNNLRTGVAGSGQLQTGNSTSGSATGASSVSFKDVLMQNLNEVNKLQEDADKQMQDFVSGKTQNVGDVISASQKASMAFSMLTQIRNKLQDAYDEVKNLRV